MYFKLNFLICKVRMIRDPASIQGVKIPSDDKGRAHRGDMGIGRKPKT
jgi:hypothetical protein